MATYQQLHEWSLAPREAVELQKRLRGQVRRTPLKKKIETIAGADISFNKFDPVVYAGVVVLRLPTLEVVEESGVVSETKFPYVPGLLSFRETPSVLEAWAKLKTEPDALMLDGQGYAHPRRFGRRPPPPPPCGALPLPGWFFRSPPARSAARNPSSSANTKSRARSAAAA